MANIPILDFGFWILDFRLERKQGIRENLEMFSSQSKIQNLKSKIVQLCVPAKAGYNI
jgi:hypothetical protein